MARVVKSSKEQVITCHIITKLTSGEELERVVNRGDIIENLRYLEKGNIKTVTGRVVDFTYETKTTLVDMYNPEDYFATDVRIKTIIIDASKEYISNVVEVDTKEIIEDEEVLDVERMKVYSSVLVKLDVEYTDGTIAKQELEVGDILKDFVAMSGTPGTPDIKGDFEISAFGYIGEKDNYPSISTMYLSNLDGSKPSVCVPFGNVIRFTEVPHGEITDPTSMAYINELLDSSETGEAYVTLGVDVTIPKREDGRITTTMIGEGKTLNLDLGGHDINCQAYAFYVNGGTLNITGEGNIKPEILDNSYPTIYVANGSTCNMYGGCIDTTQVEVPEGHENWLYGVVCSGDGVFNMYGGEMKIYGASAIAITNGTATREGAQFTIGGDAVIRSIDCGSVYLADNKSVVVKDNAKLYGGIVVRMGNISIEDNATVEATDDPTHVYPLGDQVVLSGVGCPAAGILALTGCYSSDLGNDLNINIAKTAKVKSNLGNSIEIATLNTRYDQKVEVDIESESSCIHPEDKNTYYVYNHAELAELATECGNTLSAETTTTDLTIKIHGEVVDNV